MNRLTLNVEGFLQYGVASDLAQRAASAGLTVTKARALSLKDMVDKFFVSPAEAKAIKAAVQREAIEKETLYTLLERSNYVCNVCKGTKGSSYIVHHIQPYSTTQDNEYHNLIVLCPNDHDLAHGAGLTMGISADELERMKRKWELQVERVNAAKAARSVEIVETAIDYINVRRIEELCLQAVGIIPQTRATHSLTAKGIIDSRGNFQQKYVQQNISGAKFLFDYINSGEGQHYRDLMAAIAEKVNFEDLSRAVDSGRRAVEALEGHFAFFIGGVYSHQVDIPITETSPPVLMHYSKKNIRIEWMLDPNFFYSVSAISRQGSKNRYIIYCLVRTVDCESVPGQVLVKASPLFIAQPSKYVNRIPGVGWVARNARYVEEIENEVFSSDPTMLVPNELSEG